MTKLTVIPFLLFISTSLYAADECGSDFICFPNGHPTESEAKNFQLTGENLRVVKSHAEHLKKHPQVLITLGGYTTADECGKDCDALALRRAQVAYDGLAALGIEKTRMNVYPNANVKKLNYETLKRHPSDEHGALFLMHD